MHPPLDRLRRLPFPKRRVCKRLSTRPVPLQTHPRTQRLLPLQPCPAPRQKMTQLLFDPPLFAHDLILALDRCRESLQTGPTSLRRTQMVALLIGGRRARHGAGTHGSLRSAERERVLCPAHRLARETLCLLLPQNERPPSQTNRYRTGISKKVGVKSKNCL